MLQSIIGFSVRNKLIIALFTLGLIVLGAWNVQRLPIDAVPDITDNQVVVITNSPALGAADIERLITFPVEQATRNIPGIIEQRSFSRFGLSLVTIVFTDATDLYWARQQVAERLQLVQKEIPPGMGTPEMGPVTTGLGEIFQYVIRAKPGYENRYDAIELRTIQDWIVKRQLQGTEGVAEVSSFGGKLKQYEIAVHPDKLNANHVTLTDLMTALEENNQNTGGSYIEKGPAVLFIRSEGLVSNADEIGSIRIRSLDDGTPLLLRDVADVQLGYATRYGALVYNDQGEATGGIVMMLKGENSASVIREVKRKIAEIQKTLPEGVMIEPFLDRTKMVNNAISTVTRNLAEGALIVVFILVLFLGNLRGGLLVATVIPLSMLFAVTMMNLFHVSGNLMSLGALDFGLIVDGAVIIVEAVMHRLRHNDAFRGLTRIGQAQMDEEVKSSAGKMMNAAVFGQVIILIVYLPILTLQGIEGKMFRPMAETVAFAILGAFILSLTYIPMMSSLIMSKRIRQTPTLSDKVMSQVSRLYSRSLRAALSLPILLIGSSVAIFGVAVFVMLNMGGEFIPTLEEGDFAIEARVLTGSSLTTTAETTTRAAGILLRKFPEVEKVVTKIGSGEIPTDPMPLEAADMMVILKPQREWVSAKTFDELAEKMQASLQDVPGLTTSFQYPVQMRFNELMTGGKQDVVCKIFGENLDTLVAYAERLGGIVQRVDGAQDLYVESVTGLPEIVVDFNRNALAQYHLSVGDVNLVINAAFAGAQAGQVYENERRFDLVLRLAADHRDKLQDVQNLLIATPTGQQIPLQQVADVSIRVGPNQIQREDARRRITVGFNVRGRDVQSVVQELQKLQQDEIHFPPGYQVTYGGQFENLRAANARLAIAVPVALLLIFLILYFAFGSLRHGLLIFSAIPLSAIGGVFALLIRDMPFSISAGVGFIALFGVAVLNGIVLISEFNQLKKAGITDVRERILTGTGTRLRPVLMTAAVASLGFLPMAMSHSAGSEVQRPLATVVIGGLVTATFLTLLVLPVMYYFTEGGKRIKRTRSTKRNMKNIAASLLPFLLLLLPAMAHSQALSLPAAIDTALKNNYRAQTAAVRTETYNRMEDAGWEPPGTDVGFEYGQINTYVNDNKFTLGQGISFPTVYASQKKLRQSYTMQSTLHQNVIAQEITKAVKNVYYELLWTAEKRNLLLIADSLFADFAERQDLRFRAGESNVLEKAAAETQRAQIAHQLLALETDYNNLLIRFRSLLGTDQPVSPEPAPLRLVLHNADAPVNIAEHPAVRLQQQESQILRQEWKLEQARLLPSFRAGFASQTIIGWQVVDNNDRYFGGNSRFNSVNVGLNMPLLFRHDKVRSEVNQLRITLAELETKRIRDEQEIELKSARNAMLSNGSILSWYEATGLQQARLITDNADVQLANGAISYLEWMMLIHQSISLRSDYLDAVREWNHSVILVESFQTKL